MNYQTKIKSVSTVWLLALIASIVLLFVWKSGWRFVFFAFTVLCFFAMGFIILLITQRHVTKKIGPLLFNECDPEKFLGAVYASIPPGKPRYSEFVWAMLLYEGHYAAGRYKDALDELQSLRNAKRGLTNNYQKAAYQLNLAEASAALGRPQDAEQSLGECHRLMENGKIPGKLADILRKGYQDVLCKLSIAQDRYDGAELVFEEAFAEAKHEYNRAGAKYHLALIYQHTGEEEKAREAFEYVVKHGNRLHFAALVREQLGLPPEPGIARLWRKEETYE